MTVRCPILGWKVYGVSFNRSSVLYKLVAKIHRSYGGNLVYTMIPPFVEKTAGRTPKITRRAQPPAGWRLKILPAVRHAFPRQSGLHTGTTQNFIRSRTVILAKFSKKCFGKHLFGYNNNNRRAQPKISGYKVSIKRRKFVYACECFQYFIRGLCWVIGW